MSYNVPTEFCGFCQLRLTGWSKKCSQTGSVEELEDNLRALFWLSRRTGALLAHQVLSTQPIMRRSALEIQIQSPQARYLIGETIRVDVVLRNKGPEPATVPVLDDLLAPQPYFVIQGPSYANPTGSIGWEIRL